MARQRHCRRLARNGKPAASLLTPSSSEPRTPAGKARVLDARKWLRERDGLSAGGRWIRTSGSAQARTTPGSASCAPPGQSNAPAARPRLERDQAAPGFGEEGEHFRRVIKRRATASKARPELGALLG